MKSTRKSKSDRMIGRFFSDAFPFFCFLPCSAKYSCLEVLRRSRFFTKRFKFQKMALEQLLWDSGATESWIGGRSTLFEREEDKVQERDVDLLRNVEGPPENMVAPPFSNPQMHLDQNFGDDKPVKIKFNHGTTCLAFKFKVLFSFFSASSGI